MKTLRSLGGVALFVFAAHTAAAQSFGYHTFTPPVLSAAGPPQALFTVQVTGPHTRVSLEFNPGQSGSPTTVNLRDDGLGGDAAAGDGVYSVLLPTAGLVGALRADDVQRVFAGFLDLFNGATRVARANIFADVYIPEAGSWPVLQLSPTVQASSRVVNLVWPAYFTTPGVDAVTREFYRWFDDDYDFLNIIYTPARFANRTHFAVRNDVDGIGMSRFNQTATYGSAGRLQGISQFPIPGFFDGAETGHGHELGHQWINFLNFAPLAQGIPHWPISSMAGGVMGFSIGGAGGQGGSFNCDVVDLGSRIVLNPQPNAPVFNDFDLYLMGLLPPAQVRPQIVFDNQAAAQSLQCTGQDFTGAFTRLSVQDVIDRAGARVPAAAATPPRYRVATILVSRDGPVPPEMMSLYSWFAERGDARAPVPTRSGFAKELGMPFYIATGGRASLDMSIALDPPAAPADFRATAIAGNTVTFAWTPVAGAVDPTSYVIEGGLTPGSVLGSLPVAGTPATFTAAVPTGAFYVRLHALAGPARSAASNEIRIFVNVPAPPAAPANPLGLVNGGFLALAWTLGAGGGPATGLLLDVSGSIATSLPLPVSEAFSFNGVPPGTYTLSLRAVNASGVSPPSAGITLAFPGPCSGPPLTPIAAASVNGNLATVSWSLPAAGPAPTAFAVSVTGAFTGTFSTTGRSLSGTVGPGSYTIRVTASNPCGQSAPTAPQTIAIP